MQPQLTELRALAAHAQSRRTETGIPRVAMVQGAVPEHELATVYEPMVNLILRGGKTMTVGGQTLEYDAATYFVMSIGLPAVGTVRPDEDGAPYLAVALTLDTEPLASLLTDLPNHSARPQSDTAFAVATVTADFLDAWVRLLRLMHQREDIPALAPVYEREILYRVLKGPMGWMLYDIAAPDSALSRVNRSIQAIRTNFARPFRIDELAAESAMSVSTFHRHFKAATALSPIQYQKEVRLLHARRRLLTSQCSITSVAHEVGYESLSQFSREYSRAFGLPPGKDIARAMGRPRRREPAAS